MNQDGINKLVSLINLERNNQQCAVKWALNRQLRGGQCGVVLADEVGCGKTYEALAIFSLLWYHYHNSMKPIRRVLILCKSGLLRKWHEELTTQPNQEKHGIRSYLTDSHWKPFVEQFIEGLYMIENINRAERMWWGQDGKLFRGVLEGGKFQVPEGLYLVNNQLLYASKRDKSRPLKYLHNSDWDLVIVDEVHHYGKGNDCDSIFANRYYNLGRRGKPDFGAEGTLRYRNILLLTATPFELDPNEMLNLLSIACADKTDLKSLEDLLDQYQEGLNAFYDLRALPPENEQRHKAVERLHQLRVGTNGQDGLEEIMRRYIVRNLKETMPREYTIVNQKDSALEKCQFKKFDNLKSLCTQLPLIPFTGPDALFYLEFRELIQEVMQRERPDGSARGVFVAMDLQQGLSSYSQLLSHSDKGKPKRLLERSNERAKRLRRMLEQWVRAGRLHPKVRALVEVVKEIIKYEIQQVEQMHQDWFAKIVVFNKLVSGTAPHLRNELEHVVEQQVEDMLHRLTLTTPFSNPISLRKTARMLVRKEAQVACDELTRLCAERGEQPILDSWVLNEAGFKVTRKTHAVQVFLPYFERRVTQGLFLIDFLRHCRTHKNQLNENTLRDFVHEQIIDPVLKRLDEILDKYLDSSPDLDEAKRLGKSALYETGIRDLSLLRETFRSPEIVARYDGDVLVDRESNRINFNNRWNPFVLIVSRVGEEGIDLQRHARYILHYDLEWNPAKMEQREGRVDREGYGHTGEPIDVRFFLLKGTYEERIFHTVMQRDQWFRILMGERRRQLGKI